MDFGFSDNFFTPSNGSSERDLDKRLMVQFYTEDERDDAASAAKGEDVFVPIEYIKIFQPGGGDEVERRVTDADRERFADRYEKFKKKLDQRAEGFPLDQWGGLHRSAVNEYRKVGIETVEQLASVTDAQSHHMPMGFASTRAKAQAFLKMRKESGAMEKLAAENAALNDRLAAITARLEAMEASQPKE